LKPSLAVRLVIVASCLAFAACRPPGYGKGDDAVDAAVDGRAIDSMPDGATGATCEKAFRLDGRSLATSVWVTGDFVGWAANPGAGAITLTLGGDGAWTGTHVFAAGAHQYKFIIDGTEWITDPTNPVEIDDGMGNHNSGYTCVP
jgi:hypothetical protein